MFYRRRSFLLCKQSSVESNPFDPTVVTISGITGGGVKANIVPEEVRLLCAVQAKDDVSRERAMKSVQRIAQGTAMAAGIPDSLAPIVRPSETEQVSAVYNEPALVERLTPVITAALGAKNVLHLSQQPSADDFAYFGNISGNAVPSIFIMLGASDPIKLEKSVQTGISVPGNHNPRFAPVAGTTLHTGMLVLTITVLELLKPKSAEK